jgi:hypothetical protein
MLTLFLALFAGEQTLSGIVKDAAGKPVAGATVAPKIQSHSKDPEVVATTDAAGKFQLAKPRSLLRPHTSGSLIAFHPDHGLASRALRSGESEGLELKLARGSGARIVVLDADGKPLKDVKATVALLRDGYLQIPPAIGERMAVRTDADGAATFSVVDQKKIMQFTAETAAGVKFTFYSSNEEFDWKTVRLLPTTPVKGRFSGVPWTKGDEITVNAIGPRPASPTAPLPPRKAGAPSLVPNQPATVTVALEMKVRPHDDGAFTAMAFKDGVWRVQTTRDTFWVTNSRDPAKTAPGSPEKLWTLAPTVPVSGLVRADDGKPIEGALVSLYSQSGFSTSFYTDAQGRYTGRAAPGKLNFNVTPPGGFTTELNRGVADVAATGPVELPPIIAARAASVSGVVKDETGKPASGARITGASIVTLGGGMSTHYPIGVTAGPDGRFNITGMTKGSTATLRAFDEKRGVLSNTAQASAGSAGVELKLDPSLSAQLSMLATDERGKSLRHVEYSVEFQEHYEHDSSWFQSLRPELNRPIRPKTEGAFSLGAVPKFLSFRITASAEGFLPGKSPLTPASNLNGPITVKLQRAMETTGRVVDSAGNPVVGALVKPAGCYGSEAISTTDSDGRFKLSGLPCATAVLTAQCEGFRYGGAIAKDGKPATLVLKRPSEPAPATMVAAFPPELTDVSKKLMDPVVDAIFLGKGDHKSWWAQSYAYIDPAKLLELMDGPQWKDQDREFSRHHLAAALAATDPDEAIAQAQAITVSDRKASALLEVARRLPKSAKEKRLQVLADALAAARAGTDPARKALYIARIGEALHTDGDAIGEKVIREAEAIAKKMGKDGWAAYASGTVAESLALVDFAAAMDLTKDLPGAKEDGLSMRGGSDSYTFNRHRMNMAHKIAGRQPENAEKAFNSMTQMGGHSRNAARVCYRMAPVDLPRAKKIAAHANRGEDKAVCLSAMALALGPKRKAEALSMLRDAFAALSATGEEVGYAGHGKAPLAMALVYAAVTIAPEEAGEFFWQALAAQGPPRPTTIRFGRDGRVGAVAITALLAQRFDAEIAAALATSLRGQTAALMEQVKNDRSGSDDATAAVAALVALDKQAAEEIMRQWPPPVGKGPESRSDYVRMQIGALLRATPKRRNDLILERYLHQWYIDKEDL